MNVELRRKRGVERAVPKAGSSTAPLSSALRAHLGRLQNTVAHARTKREKMRLLCAILSTTTLFFCAVCAVLFYLNPSFEFRWSESSEEWLLRHIVCPTDTLIGIPPLRRRINDVDGDGVGSLQDRRAAFAFDVNHQDEVFGSSPTVAGLDRFCAARVSEVPRWASGSWRKWRDSLHSEGKELQKGAMFNLTIEPKYMGNATYTAIGSPFCLAGGVLLLPLERIQAGGTEVFTSELLPVMPLTDAVLQKAATSNVSARLHVVPAMGLVLSGYWIATHFFHLITDALEALYGAFTTMEDGVLMHIPTQTVMAHSQATNWVDRRGDLAKKMEFSAALANGFSSPLRKGLSPYNTSFLFRPSSPYCVERDEEPVRSAPLTARTTSSATAAAAAVCFCDGLLVNTHHRPFMDVRVYYGIQDWAAQQFGAPPYVERRSVREMERLRLAQSPSWATHFWPECVPNADTTAPYRPRLLFIHRTTRLIANATRYAAWMREAGFRVEEVYLERLSAAQQYHLGRYADVVVGMHGLGIGHAMWMEREPPGCRTVIEFRPWVTPAMPLQPQRVVGQTMNFNYVPILPIDVRFGPSVKDPEKERELLLSIARVNSAFSFPSFTDQTAFYDDAEVRRVILEVRQRLDRCLPK